MLPAGETPDGAAVRPGPFVVPALVVDPCARSRVCWQPRWQPGPRPTTLRLGRGWTWSINDGAESMSRRAFGMALDRLGLPAEDAVHGKRWRKGVVVLRTRTTSRDDLSDHVGTQGTHHLAAPATARSAERHFHACLTCPPREPAGQSVVLGAHARRGVAKCAAPR